MFNTTTTTPNASLEDLAQALSRSDPRRVLPSLLGTAGVVLNVLTLVAVIRHHDLTRCLRCALVSLVSTDLGLVITAVVHAIPQSPDPMIPTLRLLSFTFADCTALTLLVLAVDRALAVFRPAWHKASSERRWREKIGVSVSLPWLLAMVLAAASIETEACTPPQCPSPWETVSHFGLLVQGLALLVCGSGVFLAYLAIGVRLKLLTRRPVVHPAFVQAPRRIAPAEGQRTCRLTSHVAFLSVWFCILYLPVSGYLLMLHATRADRRAEFGSPRLTFMSVLIMTNSFSNPVIFFWRLVNFRPILQAVRRAVTCERCARASHSQPAADVEVHDNPAMVGRIRHPTQQSPQN